MVEIDKFTEFQLFPDYWFHQGLFHVHLALDPLLPLPLVESWQLVKDCEQYLQLMNEPPYPK